MIRYFLHYRYVDSMPRVWCIFFAVVSVSTAVLPLLGGGVINQCGVPTCLDFFASAGVHGSGPPRRGLGPQVVGVVYYGQFVFGLRSESMYVAQLTIVLGWLKVSEVVFAIGIGLDVIWLGIIWNNVASLS